MMNKITRYSTIALVAITAAFTGCKKLEDYNRNPTKPTETQPQYLLTGAQKSAMDVLYSGLQNGYIAMEYAQFWTGNSRTNDAQYQLDEGNNAALWNTLYSTALHNLDDLVKQNNSKTNKVGVANQNAIALIMKSWIYQILADTYGNIPYTQAFQVTTNITPAYDDAQTIYKSLLDTLQQQINVMDENQSSFNSGDIIYNGKVALWKKLAHSLMLRMAIRMADANPQLAQQIIEAHWQNALSSNADNAQFQYMDAAPNKFPYNESEREISEFFVTSTLVDYMKSVQDPRLNIYARPARNSDTIKGLAYGTSSSDKNRLPPNEYSFPGKQVYSATMPGILMSYSEVEFILAEAAARGWNVGDATTHYNNAVRASLEYWRTLGKASYTDTDINAYLTRVPYNSADWRNVIGSQKWLAFYPQGFQAWFERTRLHFAKPGGAPLFIAPVSGTVDPKVTFVPYRLTYLISETTQNPDNYQKASQAIGGDTKGTKLWYNKF
ncbi:MAG: SusD/RagB family nutrient-binding outer membrane lipoprotein [Chitinophaga sp.]|uniref:SusD/RagB family nutrient-binding outer membrane lipoprotein n=1 Tax=Chitinophaga sp. TaxID=1869181 RepID=UPI0025C264A0|nr:SusD/RagB family nutrient-binding outer membrane lipoprotein [Chitinophaga sp.]MBV8255071.1 SusD/RagB family nutrient-binding outer membrane lipoprotein [Chitinophaga sp.]